MNKIPQKIRQKIARNLKEPKAEMIFEIQRGILEGLSNRHGHPGPA